MSNEKKIKVLWVNEKANFQGGAERYIYDTMRSLAELHSTYSVFFYSVDSYTDPAYCNAFDEAYPMVDLRIQLKEVKPDIIFVHQLYDKKFIEQILNSGYKSIRFLHDHRLFCLREHKYRTLSKKTCTEKTGLRCIFPCFGFLAKKNNSLEIKSLAKLKKLQKINSNFDSFIVGSNYMRDHAILHRFKEKKIYLNPLYSSSEFSQTVNNENKKGYFLYVGQILRGKGLDILIRAAALMKTDRKILVCGSGKQKLEFEKLASDINIKDKISFEGHLDRNELEKHYKQSTALILPSRTPETFGLAGLEAMNYSLPVIASDVGGISEWLENGFNGLYFKTDSAESLAEKMDELSSDSELYKRLSEGAQITVQKMKFSKKRHIDDLYELMYQTASV